jgi:hypothetical protein
MELLGPERVFGNTSDFAEREIYWNDIRYLRSFGNRFSHGVLPPVTQSGRSTIAHAKAAGQGSPSPLISLILEHQCHNSPTVL